MKYAYSPHTGEYINTENIADWMLTTDLTPPSFNPQVGGCFFKDGDWVIVDAETHPTLKEIALQKIAMLEQSVTQRRLREATLLTDSGWLAKVDSQIAELRGQLI
jgi:hypothetical protein